jgi:hypothetical protein
LEAFVDVGVASTYLHGCYSCIVIDGDALHLAEVDQEPFGGRVTRVVVSSRAYGDRHIVLACSKDRLAHVGGVETESDSLRAHILIAAIEGKI